jgi:fumarylacetoacetate (FAA) hydrolase family protein
MTALRPTAQAILPHDKTARLVGRVWSAEQGGPCVVYCEGDTLRDLTGLAPTVSKLLEEMPSFDTMADQPVLGRLDDFLGSGDEPGQAGSLLAPCDLQAVKAAGVTFADSMVERVIEERAKGDPSAAQGVRDELRPLIGDNLKGLVPGSEQARAIKTVLQERGYWSQYLEVGIGEFAEIFTKGQPLSSVGCGARIGISTYSHWNNPEPEVVLAVNSRGEIVGATLGNDVNLRDIEGRSALLLGKAKDNNAACAIGPFIRLFDDGFSLADVERAQLSLTVKGADGFVMQGTSDMARISRKPADLAAQTMDHNHQYPDGFVLFLGTLFAPVEDRGEPGKGFTHEVGDIVEIASDGLGTLSNEVGRCNDLPPWTFGTRALMENLAGRGLL